MKNYRRKDFLSWAQEGYDVRAVALVNENDWFDEAVNCMRDGDMGELGDDGAYERIWYGDCANIYGDDEYDYRPATPSEVDLYLRHCTCESPDPMEVLVEIVRGRQSYALYEVKGEVINPVHDVEYERVRSVLSKDSTILRGKMNTRVYNMIARNIRIIADIYGFSSKIRDFRGMGDSSYKVFIDCLKELGLPDPDVNEGKLNPLDYGFKTELRDSVYGNTRFITIE